MRTKVERGVINKGDEIEIVGLGSSFKTTLTGIGKSSDHVVVRERGLRLCRNVPQGTRSW